MHTNQNYSEYHVKTTNWNLMTSEEGTINENRGKTI